MESTGVKGKIQISQATAELINKAGKAHWLRPREDAVKAKGKGVLNTFWLNPGFSKRASSTTSSQSDSNALENKPDGDILAKPSPQSIKQERLVEWMVELLLDHIKKIVSRTSQ